jgi:putative peptidoglycan lipid II flippase
MVTTSVRLSVISAGIAFLALGCQILTARTFGARHEFDIYLVAISVPFLVVGAASGALSQAFVPRLVAAQRDPGLYRATISGLIGSTVLGGTIVVLTGFFGTIWAVAAIGGTFSAADRIQIVLIARIAWLSAGSTLLASAFAAVHHSERRFFLPAVTGAAPYAGMITAMSLLPPSTGPVMLAWGMLAGSVCATLVLLPAVLRRTPFHHPPRASALSVFDGVGSVILVVIANCAFTGLAPVEALLAPRFGPGSLSYLGYSQRIIIALGAIVVAGPSVALVPSIAAAVAARKDYRVTVLARKNIAAVLAIASLAALVFSLIRVPVIRLCLEHGAFDSTMTRGVAGTLPWMLFGSIAMLGSLTAFRVLYGQNIYRLPAVIGVVLPILYLSLGFLFVPQFGFQGICVAYATCWWLVLFVLLTIIFGFHPKRMLARIAVPLFPLVAAFTSTAVAVWVGRELLLAQGTQLNTIELTLRCGAVAGAGIALFVLMTALVWPVPIIRAIVFDGFERLVGKRCC